LHWDSTALAADLAVAANDLSTDAGLETAVLLSLFLDRRAGMATCCRTARPIGVDGGQTSSPR
jgi:phage gp46-like protein